MNISATEAGADSDPTLGYDPVRGPDSGTGPDIRSLEQACCLYRGFCQFCQGHSRRRAVSGAALLAPLPTWGDAHLCLPSLDRRPASVTTLGAGTSCGCWEANREATTLHRPGRHRTSVDLKASWPRRQQCRGNPWRGRGQGGESPKLHQQYPQVKRHFAP